MNPDDLKAALLKRLGLTPATPDTTTAGARLAALLPKQPAASWLQSGDDKPSEGMFNRLTHSSFADTLTSIAGTPGKFNYAYPSGQYRDVQGLYEGTVPYYQKDAERGQAGDKVSMTPAGIIGYDAPSVAGYDKAPGRDAEHTLAHEMGHRFEQKMKMQEMGGYDRGVPGVSNAAAFDSTVTAPKASGYAATSPGEHFAEAFANAIDFLRITAKTGQGQTDASLRPAVEEYERRVPGTTAMTQVLLAQPIYKAHPINVARQMAVRPDDSATDAGRRLAAALSQRKP